MEKIEKKEKKRFRFFRVLFIVIFIEGDINNIHVWVILIENEMVWHRLRSAGMIRVELGKVMINFVLWSVERKVLSSLDWPQGSLVIGLFQSYFQVIRNIPLGEVNIYY